MKKIYSLTVFVLLAVSAFAQKDVYVNPKIGINFSGLNDEPEGVSTNNMVGYNAGLDLRLGGGVLFFQPGAFYYQYNQEYTIINTGTSQANVVRDIKVQTIKIPVQLGVNVIPFDIFGIRINAGPAFNFPINVSGDENDFAISRDEHKDVTVGGVVGAGIDFSILTFDINYEFGLSDYIDLSDSNLQSGSSKQYVLSLNIGLRF